MLGFPAMGCYTLHMLDQNYRSAATRLTLHPSSMTLDVYRQLNPLLPPIEVHRVKDLQNLRIGTEFKYFTIYGEVFVPPINTPDDESDFNETHFIKGFYGANPVLITLYPEATYNRIGGAKFLSKDLNQAVAYGDEEGVRQELRKLGIACE